MAKCFGIILEFFPNFLVFSSRHDWWHWQFPFPVIFFEKISSKIGIFFFVKLSNFDLGRTGRIGLMKDTIGNFRFRLFFWKNLVKLEKFRQIAQINCLGFGLKYQTKDVNSIPRDTFMISIQAYQLFIFSKYLISRARNLPALFIYSITTC